MILVAVVFVVSLVVAGGLVFGLLAWNNRAIERACETFHFDQLDGDLDWQNLDYRCGSDPRQSGTR